MSGNMKISYGYQSLKSNELYIGTVENGIARLNDKTNEIVSRIINSSDKLMKLNNIQLCADQIGWRQPPLWKTLICYCCDIPAQRTYKVYLQGTENGKLKSYVLDPEKYKNELPILIEGIFSAAAVEKKQGDGLIENHPRNEWKWKRGRYE